MNTFTRTQILAATLVFGSVAATTAHAQDQGFYAGIGLGVPSYPDTVNGVSGSGSSLGGKLYGGYQLTPNFALEAGATQFGRSSNAQGNLSAHAEYLDAVGKLPLDDKWALLAKVGVARVNLNTSNGDDSGTGLKVGVGAEYAITRDLSLRGEVERYRADAFGSNPNVGQYTFGVRLGF